MYVLCETNPAVAAKSNKPLLIELRLSYIDTVCLCSWNGICYVAFFTNSTVLRPVWVPGL